ncbi:sugar phosphate isomerase/epimerase family protein [Metabacillus sp. Hm71]|uniref:sugar phosphate isomerase/epimerase family protein n=1 Tax=Metabacillus sp. Hm71 TaxID=3450743 RepID=UPI003F42A365
MNNVIVPLNAFNRNEVLEKGQAAFVKDIALSGAFGIEIRRELFLEGDIALELVKREIENEQLFTVFSAPIEVWGVDHTLNNLLLQRTIEEAKLLGAQWLKVSLGHYHQEHSNVSELKDLLKKESIQLFVENDQTKHGGNVECLRVFFENASNYEVPVKMTFDSGNWYYTEQSIQKALEQLSPYVGYLHLKHVENRGGSLVTLPLMDTSDAEWRKIVRLFPHHLPKALEFPIDPVSKMKDFIKLVQEAVLEESEGII